MMYDDGFVAYINGQETGRALLPAPSPRDTRAQRHEANNIYQSYRRQRSLRALGT